MTRANHGAIRTSCGIVLIAAGLLAIPIPVIPGVPLIVAGAAMLGSNHPLVRYCWKWLHEKGIWKQQRKPDDLSSVRR